MMGATTAQQRAWYQRNAERLRAAARARYAADPATHRAKVRARKLADPEKHNAARRAKVAVNRENRKRWGLANPEREQRLRIAGALRKYGITPSEFDAMASAQGGLCAICKQPEASTLRGKSRRLSVDHDHRTGKVRALLCSRCNTAIGMVEEDEGRLLAAAEYLRSHK